MSLFFSNTCLATGGTVNVITREVCDRLTSQSKNN